MMFENLEDRRLLSASLAKNVLTIDGTSRNDTIYVAKQGGNVTVQVNNVKKAFKAGDVRKMVVRGHAGNDKISFGYGTIGATIDGGDGNDRIIGTSSPDNITAGRGNDYVHAWLGNDVVNGHDGNDTIIGCMGNDTIRGGNGNDLVSGAKGDDVIFGEAGNDTLYGAAGNDRVDGGDGSDATRREGNDRFTKVEKVWR